MSKPTLADVVNKAVDGALARARVMLPGRIEAYNSVTRRADVRPLVTDMYADETGKIVARAIPVLTDVPVVFPGSGGVRMKWPINVGDMCELVFASSSIARLKVIGNPSAPVNPGDTRHHALPDCVAHLGLQFRADDADALIEFTDDGRILAGGTEPLVKRSEFLSHSHATAATGVPSPPVVGGAPGSSVTFPGTEKLRG